MPPATTLLAKLGSLVQMSSLDPAEDDEVEAAWSHALSNSARPDAYRSANELSSDAVDELGLPASSDVASSARTESSRRMAQWRDEV